MWLTFAFGFTVLAALAPVAAPAHPGRALPPSAAALLGSWTCTGPVAGSVSNEIFARGRGPTLRLENAVRTSFGARGTVDETYAYDATNRTWTLTAPANRFFDRILLTTAANPGRGRWTFTGTQSTGGNLVPVRIAYEWLAPNAFRREHFVAIEGGWRPDGAFMCRRAGEPQVARRSEQPAQSSLSWNVSRFARSSSSRSSSK